MNFMLILVLICAIVAVVAALLWAVAARPPIMRSGFRPDLINLLTFHRVWREPMSKEDNTSEYLP